MKKEWLSSFIINDLKINKSLNFYPLIYVSDPIFVIVSNHDELFLMYMLQDRGIMKNGKRVKIKEILYAETTFNDILEMFDSKRSINNILVNSKNASRVGFIGRKKYPEKKVEDFTEISNRIPCETVMLDSQIPSKVNMDLIKKIIQAKANRFSEFSFDSAEENLSFNNMNMNNQKKNKNTSISNLRLDYNFEAIKEEIFKESIVYGAK